MPNISSPDFPPPVNRENEACDEPTIGQPGKPPRNAKWAPRDDVTLVESLKAFADGNSADNGTFKSAALPEPESSFWAIGDYFTTAY
ncbi:hypothetical protein BDR04DRAFT_1235529 [Suillus decipiens]|nr:hypothetical protein BDR04DRAFT_1235529 [Suillus decipiens]